MLHCARIEAIPKEMDDGVRSQIISGTLQKTIRTNCEKTLSRGANSITLALWHALVCLERHLNNRVQETVPRFIVVHLRVGKLSAAGDDLCRTEPAAARNSAFGPQHFRKILGIPGPPDGDGFSHCLPY